MPEQLDPKADCSLDFLELLGQPEIMDLDNWSLDGAYQFEDLLGPEYGQLGGKSRISVGFTGGGLLRVYSCSDVVANRCRF